MEGYQVLPVAEAARVGELFVTVTGNRDALTLEHLSAMPPGAVVANAGHFDLEIDVAALRRAATAADPLPPGVHPVPAAVEERVARHKLAALGVRCDALTAPQEDYLRGWRLGT
jgi:S-adenosylhomocysteine hydrolase